MKLSKNFSLEEFTTSTTAVKNGIDNTPNQRQIQKLKNICDEILQPLRDAFGKPIQITSGYRCEALNKIVGGVAESQHQDGEAVDFWCENLEWAFGWIQEHCEFDQLIWEHGRWIHVSFVKNRGEVKFIK